MRPLLIATAITLSVFAKWAIADLESDRAALSAYLNGALSKDDGFEDRFAAEVWLVDDAARLAPLLPDPDERLDLPLKSINKPADSIWHRTGALCDRGRESL